MPGEWVGVLRGGKTGFTSCESLGDEDKRLSHGLREGGDSYVRTVGVGATSSSDSESEPRRRWLMMRVLRCGGAGAGEAVRDDDAACAPLEELALRSLAGKGGGTAG